MNKANCILNSTQRSRIRQLISVYVSERLRTSDEFHVETLIESILNEIPIEDLYTREYLIATGDSLLAEE